MGREKKGAVGVKRYEMDVKYHGILLGDIASTEDTVLDC